MSRLVLGTAQLGMDYGIANKQGKPSFKKALDIINLAWTKGIDSFDTSPLYGDSENILGQFITKEKGIAKRIKVVSKFPKQTGQVQKKTFDAAIKHTLFSLGLSSLDCYMLHDSEAVFNDDLIELLILAKAEGLIRKMGVSIYELPEAFAAVEKGFDALQIPVNLFDHRFLDVKFTQTVKNKGVELYGRSVFLQGLFAVHYFNLPKHLESAKPYLQKLESIALESNLSIAEIAIGFINNFKEIEHIIFGIDSKEQLLYNLNCFDKTIVDDNLCQYILNIFKYVPKHVYDPRSWKGR